MTSLPLDPVAERIQEGRILTARSLHFEVQGEVYVQWIEQVIRFFHTSQSKECGVDVGLIEQGTRSMVAAESPVAIDHGHVRLYGIMAVTLSDQGRQRVNCMLGEFLLLNDNPPPAEDPPNETGLSWDAFRDHFIAQWPTPDEELQGVIVQAYLVSDTDWLPPCENRAPRSGGDTLVASERETTWSLHDASPLVEFTHGFPDDGSWHLRLAARDTFRVMPGLFLENPAYWDRLAPLLATVDRGDHAD